MRISGDILETVFHKAICQTRIHCSPVDVNSTLFLLYNSWNSSGQNTGVERLPSPGDLPNPGIEARSPALQADSLPAEPQGKPTYNDESVFSITEAILCKERSCIMTSLVLLVGINKHELSICNCTYL